MYHFIIMASAVPFTRQYMPFILTIPIAFERISCFILTSIAFLFFLSHARSERGVKIRTPPSLSIVSCETLVFG